MRVLTTGGTGFAGSHTAAAVVRAGHTVLLLVREPERVNAALAPLGISVQDIVSGDVLDPQSVQLDPQSVQTAIAGCHAVAHAAAIYSRDPRKAANALATNPSAMRNPDAAARRVGDMHCYSKSWVYLRVH